MMSLKRSISSVALCAAVILVASLAVPSMATPSPPPDKPSPALQRWASGAVNPAEVLAAIRRAPDKVPAEFDERLKWADADGSLQVMVSLTSRDDRVESFIAANTIELAWYGDHPRFLARVTPGQLISLLRSSAVLFVEPDYPITNFMSDSAADVRARTVGADGVYSFDPASGPLGRLVSNVPGLTAEQVTGAGVRVAITDSGIDKTHRDFGGWDCTPGPYQPCESRIVETVTTDHLVPGFESSDALPTTEAASGHGSHVAGTIAGNGYYSRDFGADAPRYGGDGYVIGIAPNAELISVKNGDSQWAGLSSFALQWQLDNAAELGIKGSSNSWGCLGGCSFNGSSATGQLLHDLYNAGVVVTFAVGNDDGGPDGSSFSGNAQSPYVLGVAAYDDATDQLASFSSRGSSSAPLYDVATWTPESEPVNGTRRPDVAAPGVGIWSAASLTGGTSAGLPRVSLGDVDQGRGPTVEYRIMGGTSMATPHVSGTAALLFSACPTAEPLDVMRAIIAGANATKVKKTGGGGTADPFEVGYGGLDVRASLDRLLTLEACGGAGDPDPTPTPTVSPTPSPTPTTPLGADATYYFHSGTGSNNLDHLDGSTTFDPVFPTFEEPASAIDVPGLQNVSGIEVQDPVWSGELLEPATSLTIDFWGRTLPDQAIGTVHYTVRVKTSGEYFELAPAIDREVAAGSGFTRVTHTYTSALEGTQEVPLSLPAGPFTIAVRGTFTVDNAATEIRFDSTEFPSGFSTSGGASSSPSPSPTSSPSPTVTPTPDPSPTEGGSRGSYPETPNDPYFGEDPADPLAFAPTQWALRKVQAPQAWQQLRATGFGIRVAVLDTGVDLQHEDLQCAGKLDVGPGSDVVGGDSDPDDENSHGTHVAGIIGACTDNGTGVAGVAPDATLVPVRVLNAGGSGNDAQFIAGLNKAVELGVHVVNMSLGYPPGKEIINNVSAIDAAIGRARDAGIVLVAAAGNDSFPLCEYPALAEDIICVGATDPRDLKSFYSVFPNKTDAEDTIGPGMVAPGGTGAPFCDTYSENVLSTIPLEFDTNGCTDVQGYANNFGTSMATPHVAGVAALVYDRLGGERSEEAAAQVIAAIIDNADDLGAPGYDPVFGWGRLNASRAVQAISVGPDPSTSPSPTPSGSPSATPSSSPSPTPSSSPTPDTEVTTLTFSERSQTSGQYTDEALIEARLTDSAGDPVPNAEIEFELIGDGSGRTFSATTDDDGLASVTPSLDENPGPHQLTATYRGSEVYESSSDTTGFVVEREDSATELTVDGQGNSMTLTARLSDLDTPADGIGGRTVEFYSDSESIGSSETTPNGEASVPVPAGHRGANRTYEAVFTGDGFFLGSAAERSGQGGNGKPSSTRVSGGGSFVK